MQASDFLDILRNKLKVDFFAGVPDSLLSPFTEEIVRTYGISDKHIIAANEGNAAALAAGYHLASGKIPCVYMQNSGQGNIINPFTSLLAPEVYNIPCVFIQGWRGEPGVKDEPQHVFQGKITVELTKVLKMEYIVLSGEESLKYLEEKCEEFKKLLSTGKCVAFIIKKNALKSNKKEMFFNNYLVSREEAIKEILKVAQKDIIICTTGKASRELYEIRDQTNQSHQHDFLTVGSMGHSSSIALTIALNKKKRKVWCIDGDGAVLMHMGAMAVIGANAPKNYIHVLLNNEAHETVGGMPTVSGNVDFLKIAEGCGYQNIYQANNLEDIASMAEQSREAEGLSFIEVKVALGAREDLGRPTTTAEENKKSFMKYLGDLT